jgi:hypothetical protein
MVLPPSEVGDVHVIDTSPFPGVAWRLMGMEGGEIIVNPLNVAP